MDGEGSSDLLRFARAEYVADGIKVSGSNLPVECRQFGGDKIWAHMYDEMLQGKRNLVETTIEDWILKSRSMAAPEWCAKYLAENDIADLQSTHAIFKIETSTVTVRINIGVNHQGGGELDCDGRVLPDLEFWQMDVGLHGLNVENPKLSGILGKTARPVRDENGLEVMDGFKAFRGTVDDCAVSESLGTHSPSLTNASKAKSSERKRPMSPMFYRSRERTVWKGDLKAVDRSPISGVALEHDCLCLNNCSFIYPTSPRHT